MLAILRAGVNPRATVRTPKRPLRLASERGSVSSLAAIRLVPAARIARRIDHDAAELTFADASGGHRRVAGQCQVDDSPLTRPQRGGTLDARTLTHPS